MNNELSMFFCIYIQFAYRIHVPAYEPMDHCLFGTSHGTGISGDDKRKTYFLIFTRISTLIPSNETTQTQFLFPHLLQSFLLNFQNPSPIFKPTIKIFLRIRLFLILFLHLAAKADPLPIFLQYPDGDEHIQGIIDPSLDALPLFFFLC